MTITRNFNNKFDKIKIENRKHIVNKLQTGDLIKTKADSLPIIYHYGIIERSENDIFIIHNHPNLVNSNGGNTTKQPLEKWIAGKDIISVEHTNLNVNDINELVDILKKHKYDFINFNCEHFVNFAKNKDYVSPQVLRWTSIAIIGISVYFLLKNKKL
jgi:hypothetical protein